MFISARSENVVYICALQFPLEKPCAVKQLHIPSRPSLLLNMYISGFSSVPGFPCSCLDSRLKFEVVLSGFIVGYIVFSRKKPEKEISPVQTDSQSLHCHAG